MLRLNGEGKVGLAGGTGIETGVYDTVEALVHSARDPGAASAFVKQNLH